ncbi:sensor histidine kinase [Plantactinospora sp. KLBMP9567]|uniref:sensor histidine kinase n=1 Tax=Plantactinospora sp. KLBMP9567 TaxID=3085900 RepID=UPI00298290FA|nr:histidine kinase [Plantactinospora sp. KLBMP9567]MDW5327272.1 histidine kinase [Plantactinospora sp. KLBMP9567]
MSAGPEHMTEDAVPAPRRDAGRTLPGLLRRALRLGAGLLIGAVTATVELTYLLGLGSILLVLWVRAESRRTAAERIVERIETGARQLAEVERWRLATFLGSESAADYTGRRAVRYLAVRWAVGMLGGFVLLLFGWGVLSGGVWIWEAVHGESTLLTFLAQLVLGLVGLFLVVQGATGVVALDRRAARRFLGPSGREVLERRITELATSRAGVVAAVDAERRRIERDLHDGVQQRLVALGMLVGRARRTADPAKAAELLRQAHEESGRVLDDLREVAWRVYPTALDNLGLADALARVAEHAGLPVRIDHRLTGRPARAVETAAYFVVSEAVTNAAKHARASRVDVEVVVRDGRLVVTVVDDGVGGADPAGVGLSGLARRVAALDGRFRVQSPTGGPTTVVAELPCE